ncbi:MAG: hypothetical protein QOJ93_1506 [Actinomycetota bacterium]|jgi:hypothetical protein|nr:hypothetical protein [Actinomycetota bacterium]
MDEEPPRPRRGPPLDPRFLRASPAVRRYIGKRDHRHRLGHPADRAGSPPGAGHRPGVPGRSGRWRRCGRRSPGWGGDRPRPWVARMGCGNRRPPDLGRPPAGSMPWTPTSPATCRSPCSARSCPWPCSPGSPAPTPSPRSSSSPPLPAGRSSCWTSPPPTSTRRPGGRSSRASCRRRRVARSSSSPTTSPPRPAPTRSSWSRRGNTAEHGTHAELLALGGRYARMWER